jgi:hypothetical protein
LKLRAHIGAELPGKVISFYIMPLDPGTARGLRGTFRSSKGGTMDPKLVKQFFIFLVLLFGWTVIILLIGPK